MIKRENKKGLSPVIATVLLIAISLAIAMIIFLWAKATIGESTLKFKEPISNSCDRISFAAESDLASGKINIENKGNVALYGVEIRKKDTGSVIDVKTLQHTIFTGETGSVELPSELLQGDEIIIVPVILGESGNYKKPYTCAESYGVGAVV